MYQRGGCSLCGSHNTNMITCPYNNLAKNPDWDKHYNIAQTGGGDVTIPTDFAFDFSKKKSKKIKIKKPYKNSYKKPAPSAAFNWDEHWGDRSIDHGRPQYYKALGSRSIDKYIKH